MRILRDLNAHAPNVWSVTVSRRHVKYSPLRCASHGRVKGPASSSHEICKQPRAVRRWHPTVRVVLRAFPSRTISTYFATGERNLFDMSERRGRQQTCGSNYACQASTHILLRTRNYKRRMYAAMAHVELSRLRAQSFCVREAVCSSVCIFSNSYVITCAVKARETKVILSSRHCIMDWSANQRN